MQIFDELFVSQRSAFLISQIHFEKLFLDWIEVNIAAHLQETGFGFDEGFAESSLEEVSAGEVMF